MLLQCHHTMFCWWNVEGMRSTIIQHFAVPEWISSLTWPKSLVSTARAGTILTKLSRSMRSKTKSEMDPMSVLPASDCLLASTTTTCQETDILGGRAMIMLIVEKPNMLCSLAVTQDESRATSAPRSNPLQGSLSNCCSFIFVFCDMGHFTVCFVRLRLWICKDLFALIIRASPCRKRGWIGPYF